MTAHPYDHPFEGSPEQRAAYEYQLTLDHILPLLRRWDIDVQGKSILDLGCGGGGLSVALAENGAHCVGADLKEERIAEASQMATRHGVAVTFQVSDVLEMDQCGHLFDLIVLSEVVEHLRSLSNVEVLLAWCRKHLSPLGSIYVSFPPWLSPFAGHQAGWPAIRYLPWYHLLPDRLKRLLVPKTALRYIEFVQELNKLTVDAFESIADQVGLTVSRRELYHIRPEYHFRYGLPAIPVSSVLAEMPLIREITTMGAFYLLAKR